MSRLQSTFLESFLGSFLERVLEISYKNTQTDLHVLRIREEKRIEYNTREYKRIKKSSPLSYPLSYPWGSEAAMGMKCFLTLTY